MLLLSRIKVFWIGVACFTAVSVLAFGEDRFALTVSDHDKLVVFGPKGERVVELSVPSIAQPATVGSVSFQISYGRDNGLLKAILAPSETAPAALHFNVLGKSVDADGAVVTLIFASNLRSVTIDPGYVGNVEVNSHRLRRRSLSEELAPPPVISPKVEAAITAVTQPVETAAPTLPAPTPDATAQTVSAPTVTGTPPSQSLAPAMLASQLSTSVLGDTASSESPTPASEKKSAETDVVSAATPQTETKSIKLYWAEPVTPPDGPPPACALDEIRLVEVHGSVSITSPDGETRTGSEGMLVPSGSSVVTADNASAALFMGGINSARLMPHCDLTVTQSFDGTTRKDALDLRLGAVFSRVGKRSGETQDYQVRTSEGSTGAQCPNMLAFRGTADDIPALRTAMNSGLLLDPHRLLAWNPISLGRNLVSDVANPLLGALPGKSSTSTMFFYANNSSLNVSEVQSQVLAADQTSGQNTGNTNNPNTILQGILLTVVPYNTKLNALLADVNNGSPTPRQLAFYHELISVFFDNQVPGIAKKNGSNTQAEIAATRQILLRDLNPFGNTPLATPF